MNIAQKCAALAGAAVIAAHACANPIDITDDVQIASPDLDAGAFGGDGNLGGSGGDGGNGGVGVGGADTGSGGAEVTPGGNGGAGH